MEHSEGGTDRVQELFEAELGTVDRVLDYVHRRHHLPIAEADDFNSFVKLRLIENDYAVLRQFSGRSSLRTYLCVVVQRLLLDYRTSAWGKWRPSAEARRAGPVAVLLDRLLTRDGHSFDEACEILLTNYRSDVTRSELARLASRLPQRATRHFEPEDALASIPDARPSAEQQMMGADRDSLARRLGLRLQDCVAELPYRDRLALKLRFEDGRTAGEIAGLLGGTERGTYTQIERLLRTLRRALEEGGFAKDAVRDLLGDRTPFIMGSVSLELSTACPSIPEEA